MKDEFRALWDRIKYKTTYRVNFDNERLVNDCVRGVRDAPPIERTRLQWRKAGIAIGKAGVEATELAGSSTVVLTESEIDLPDILTELQDRTLLTRRTIQRVLSASGRLEDFRHNPQLFIEQVAATMNRCKAFAIVAGISYQRLGDEHYYAQELLDREMVGYVRNMIDDSANKSAYDRILYESEVEAEFARRLELDSAVKLFAKLPRWFEIPTPLGAYTPDWAILVDRDGAERMYFVVETKGSTLPENLRDVEKGKITCGGAHFKALKVMEPPAKYIVATTLDDVLTHAAAT